MLQLGRADRLQKRKLTSNTVLYFNTKQTSFLFITVYARDSIILLLYLHPLLPVNSVFFSIKHVPCYLITSFCYMGSLFVNFDNQLLKVKQDWSKSCMTQSACVFCKLCLV